MLASCGSVTQCTFLVKLLYTHLFEFDTVNTAQCVNTFGSYLFVGL